MSKNESVVQLGQVLKDRLSGNLMLLVIVNHNHWPTKEKHSLCVLASLSAAQILANPKGLSSTEVPEPSHMLPGEDSNKAAQVTTSK